VNFICSTQNLETDTTFTVSTMRVKKWLFRSVMPLIITGMLIVTVCESHETGTPLRVRVMTFNILAGGNHAPTIGFPNSKFGGSRKDDIARVILTTKADVVGIQEDDPSDGLFNALGTGWHRVGSVYAKYPLTPVDGGVRVHLPLNQSMVVVNAHWWPTGGYGPELVQARMKLNNISKDLNQFEKEILNATSGIANGTRGYSTLIRQIKPFIAAGETVIVTGDFNEPSHEDWNSATSGMDRWAKNTSGRPLRFKIAWAGSVALAKAGLKDAYRSIYPNPAKKPGNTWTPPYPDGLTGRQPYADQVLDRIDRIHFFGPNIRVVGAGVIGENAETSETVLKGPWVSDHRAVVAEFEFIENADSR
jgi:hypothetical protein